MAGRVMALDVGDKRIGIAVSDALGLTAQPVETYARASEKKDVSYLAGLAAKLQADAVVVGMPRNMDGTLGAQAEKTRGFAGKLREVGLTILWVDERLTTAVARRALIEGGVRRADRKKSIDTVAAVQILMTYLSAPHRARTWEEIE
jgi:putative Holliday junction resolvase